MAVAIHIEINALCLLILCFIAYQSAHSVSQQMTRVLFRDLVYGIIVTLALDILWLLIDGRIFPGAFALNKLVNALFLGAGVLLGGVWYLYVLECLGHRLKPLVIAAVLAPGLFFCVLNLISMWTGWIFYITEENVYMRGPLFWLQEIGVLSALFIPLFHILGAIAARRQKKDSRIIKKLLGFYIVPVIGMLASMPYAGMPGAWTCAAISVVLLYIDDQEREILRDSLTGLNNRKTLEGSFADFLRQRGEGRVLYLYMLDLNRFKRINDTYGHEAGDRALVTAAQAMKRSAANRKCIIARYGGDEFLILGLLSSTEDAQGLKDDIARNFQLEAAELPFPLSASIGMVRYQEDMQLQDMVKAADAMMYQEKRRLSGA